jgi:hypothetical protein
LLTEGEIRTPTISTITNTTSLTTTTAVPTVTRNRIQKKPTTTTPAKKKRVSNLAPLTETTKPLIINLTHDTDSRKQINNTKILQHCGDNISQSFNGTISSYTHSRSPFGFIKFDKIKPPTTNIAAHKPQSDSDTFIFFSSSRLPEQLLSSINSIPRSDPVSRVTDNYNKYSNASKSYPNIPVSFNVIVNKDKNNNTSIQADYIIDRSGSSIPTTTTKPTDIIDLTLSPSTLLQDDNTPPNFHEPDSYSLIIDDTLSTITPMNHSHSLSIFTSKTTATVKHQLTLITETMKQYGTTITSLDDLNPREFNRLLDNLNDGQHSLDFIQLSQLRLEIHNLRQSISVTYMTTTTTSATVTTTTSNTSTTDTVSVVHPIIPTVTTHNSESVSKKKKKNLKRTRQRQAAAARKVSKSERNDATAP